MPLTPLIVGFALLLLPCARATVAAGNDYPTEARVEYVLECMGANGQTPEMLRKCSCSIDLVASRIPYEKIIQVETILRMREVPGDRTAVYRSAPWAAALVDELRDAQAESTLHCF